MPIIRDPLAGQPLTTPRGFIPITGMNEETHPTPPPSAEVPDLEAQNQADAWVATGVPQLPFIPGYAAAALKQSNTIGSAIAKWQDTNGVSNDVSDPNYSPWKDVAGTPYEKYYKNTFAYSNNPAYTQALKRSIDRQNQDARTVAAGGFGGTVAGILAGTADPTLLIPGGGEIGLAEKSVWSLGKGVVAGAKAGAVGITAQELGLHASQDTRTTEESLINIGTGTVLGAVLGGTIAGALSKTQRVASEAGLEALDKINVPPEAASAGAASTYRPTLDDLTIEGKAARGVAAATAFSPNTRGNFYESPLARQTIQEISDIAPIQHMHIEGNTLGQDVTNSIRVSLAETLDQAIIKHRELFAEGKKDYGMSSDDFNNAVGDAMRNNDVGVNEAVSKTARMWRDTVTDPLLKQAIEMKMLPEDVSVSEAPSYFTRDWNKEKLIAQTPDVINRFADHFKEQLDNGYQQAVEEMGNRHAELNMDEEAIKPINEPAPIPETRGKGVQYHGARGDIGDLTEGHYNPNNIYGGYGNFYTTDAMDIAKGYGRKNPAAKIYKVSEKLPVKTFDMEKELTAEEVDKLFANDDLAGLAVENLQSEKQPVNLRTVFDEMRRSSGSEGISKDEVQERWDTAIHNLREQGYGGMTHKGGLLTKAKEHAVKIYFEPENQLKLDEVKLKEKVGKLTEAQQAKLDEIKAKRAELERKFLDRWEIKRGGSIDLNNPGKLPDFTEHARDLAREVHQRLTGQDYGSNLIDPEYSRPIAFGPLKGRTFHIEDEKVKDLLNSNVMEVMSKTARRMASQIELTRKFGNINLGDRIEAVGKEYQVLGEHAATEEERTALAKDYKNWVRDIIALRDMHLGTYMAKENASVPGRVARALKNVNFILRMGGPALPHLSNLYAPALMHGTMRFMEDGIAPLVKGMDAIGPLNKEARWAVGLEGITHHQMLTMTALGDPYAKGTRFERLLDNMTKTGAKLNGLNILMDGEKNISSWVNQGRLNEALMNGGDEQWLAYSGMTKAQQSTAAKFLKKYGTEEAGHLVANTDRWIEEGGPAGWEAARAYRVAIAKNVNSDIVSRAPGDLPLMAQTPLGSLFFQFKTFQLIAHQRMLLRTLQLPAYRAISGMMGLTTLGMLAATIKAWRSGADGWTRFKDSSKNPGYLVGEGLDNAAFFTLPLYVGDDVERITGSAGQPINPVKLPLSIAGRLIKPDAPIAANSQQGELSNDWTSVFGPSISLGSDVIHGIGGPIVAKAHGQQVTKKEVHAAQRLVPYGSYIGMRELLQATSGESPYEHQ